VSLLLAGALRAEEPVVFADVKLKQAVESTLWVSDPTPTDMLGLTSLHVDSLGISDLTGLHYAVNLGSLWLRYNEISDISALSALSDLEYLVLHRNPISSLGPLSGLSKLYHLNLDTTTTSDISPLSGLANLRVLDLYNNRVSDISPLSALTSLVNVDLRQNPLNQEAYSTYIPRIIHNNPGITILYSHPPDSGPHHVVLSSTIGGSVIQPGEGEFIIDEYELLLIEARADPGYVFAGLSGSLYMQENPTLLMVTQSHQIQANFVRLLDVLHVKVSAPDNPKEDGTPEHPFGNIQEAINVAACDTTILVHSGVYRENINLLGKKIHLAALDPTNPHGGPCVVLEGIGGDPVVRIPPGSGSQCSLTGFVITRGQGPLIGAIECSGSSPVISNCLIVGNRTTDPNGAIMRFQNSRAILANCTIADNYAGAKGAALRLTDSNIVMIDSILWGNGPQEIERVGQSVPSIRFCNIRGGWPDLGNIDADPLFARHGSWADPEDLDKALGPQDLRAVWIGGDYHLKSQAGRWDPLLRVWVLDERTSSCIDAGSIDSPVGHEPMPNGDRINLGAYGGTSEASKSP
jgi:hypothetical protein